jgi:hypothetical protein
MNPAPGDNDLAQPSWWLFTPVSREETMLALATLVFTVVALGFASIFLRHRTDCSSADIIRLFGLILIVGSTLFLMSAGFDSKMVTGAIGLLGVIAGYILGKGENPASTPKDKNDAADRTG